MPRELQIKDVVRLLRSEIEKAGGQKAWAKKAGIERTIVNRALSGRRKPTMNILKALNLRMGILSD